MDSPEFEKIKETTDVPLVRNLVLILSLRRGPKAIGRGGDAKSQLTITPFHRTWLLHPDRTMSGDTGVFTRGQWRKRVPTSTFQ
jgi:hypothetical protein